VTIQSDGLQADDDQDELQLTRLETVQDTSDGEI